MSCCSSLLCSTSCSGRHSCFSQCSTLLALLYTILYLLYLLYFTIYFTILYTLLCTATAAFHNAASALHYCSIFPTAVPAAFHNAAKVYLKMLHPQFIEFQHLGVALNCILHINQCVTVPKMLNDTDTDTFSGTKYFRYRYRYFFRYQIFPRLFSDTKFIDTGSKTFF